MQEQEQEQQQRAEPPLPPRGLSPQHSAADLQAAASELRVCAEVLTCQRGLVRTLTPTAGGLQTSGVASI